jgi:hypothetical protein
MSDVSATISIMQSLMERVNDKESVVNMAKWLRLQTDQSMDERLEQMINAPASGIKGVAARAVYDLDGTSYSGSALGVFIKLSTSTAMFHQGEPVKILYGGDGDITHYIVGKITAVCHGEYALGSDMGPGIAVLCSATTYSGSLNTTASNIYLALAAVVASDTIFPVSETGSACGFLLSLPALWDRSGAFFNKLRTSAYPENDYLVPGSYPAGTSSSAAELQVSIHLRKLFAELSKVIPDADNRMRIQSGEKGPEISKAVVMDCSHDLLFEMMDQASQPGARFTRSLANTPDKAMEAVYGQAGGEGMVYHYPGMQPIIVQANGLMAPDEVRVWDPQQAALIEMFGGRVLWAKAPGSTTIWNQMQTSPSGGGANALLPQYNAGCRKVLTPFYFTPKAFGNVKYVKPSV